MSINTRYLTLLIASLVPQLSGCLEHFSLKADVESHTVEEGDEDAEIASEKQD